MNYLSISGQGKKPINDQQTIRDVSAELSKANQCIFSVVTTIIDHDHLNLNDVDRAIAHLNTVKKLVENHE